MRARKCCYRRINSRAMLKPRIRLSGSGVEGEGEDEREGGGNMRTVLYVAVSRCQIFIYAVLYFQRIPPPRAEPGNADKRAYRSRKPAGPIISA